MRVAAPASFYITGIEAVWNLNKNFVGSESEMTKERGEKVGRRSQRDYEKSSRLPDGGRWGLSGILGLRFPFRLGSIKNEEIIFPN